jgi:isoquinoline 1-oxidoreductase beta subunit
MYDTIPHHRAVQWHTTLPFATSWWRSLGLLANTFAIESFVDEMALKAGKDPVAFRLSMLGEEEDQARIKKVIQLAAEKARLFGYRKWGQSHGLCCFYGHGYSLRTGRGGVH